MKKMLAIVTILMFGFAQSAFAQAVLSDTEMDGVSAGDWVIIEDADGNQSVVDVYYNNNDIQLLNESQTDLKAVNNANAVDSAIAVQTNIARVTSENAPTNNVGINGTNEAEILNYNPADSQKSSETKSCTETKSEHKIKTLSKTESENCSESFSSSESESASCNLNVNYNRDENSAGTNQSVAKGEICQGSSTGTEVEVLVVVSTKSESESESCSASKEKTSSLSEICAEEETEECSIQNLEEKSSENRSNKSENNHLTLLNTSQKNLQAVSNLNSVGSGAAIQTNIASNVGVSGTITHVNTAKVVNGL